MVDVADSEPGQAPPPAPAEPVRVARITEGQARVAEAYESLRRELGGLIVDDDAGMDAYGLQVGLRVKEMRKEGLAEALLVALLIERLAGYSDKAVVKVPRPLLKRRIATKGSAR